MVSFMNDTAGADRSRLEVRTYRNPALEDMVARAWMTLAEGHAGPRTKVVPADKEQQDE